MSKKHALLVLVAVVAVLFGIGVVTGLLLPRLAGLMFQPRPYNTVALLQQVKTLSDLVTVQYVIEKVVVVEDVKWIAGLGENRVLLVAHGVVKAGVDFGQVKPEDVRISGKKVRLKLPPARITDSYLDDQQTRVIERTTGLLRFFDKDLEQTARQNAVDDIRRAARLNGINREAEDRARTLIRKLLEPLGLEIEFE